MERRPIVLIVRVHVCSFPGTIIRVSNIMQGTCYNLRVISIFKRIDIGNFSLSLSSTQPESIKIGIVTNFCLPPKLFLLYCTSFPSWAPHQNMLPPLLSGLKSTILNSRLIVHSFHLLLGVTGEDESTRKPVSRGGYSVTQGSPILSTT